MNKILPIILVVVFSPDAFAGTSVGDFFGGLFVFAFLGFVFYILYKILESLGKKAKNKFDDSVVGMSLKVKKEKLKQELDEIERKKDNNLNNEFQERANTTKADIQNKDFESYENEFKKIFNSIPKEEPSEVWKEQLFKQWLDHLKQSGQPEPDFEARVMMSAFILTLEDESISFFKANEYIHNRINRAISEWSKEYEERGLTVNEYAINCQKKYSLASGFPGTYTKEEYDFWKVESHANILGVTIEEYLARYDGGKNVWLEDK